MSIDKLTPLGESGSLEDETTFENWVDNGFVNERVRYTRLNRQFNRGDTRINDLADRGTSTIVEETDAVKGLFTQSNSSHSTHDGNAYIEGTTFAEPTDLSYAKIAGTRYLLAASYDQINLYNIDTMAEGSSVSFTTLLAGLPGTVGTNGSVLSVCNDEVYAYVLIVVTDPAPDEFYVQSYKLTDWSVNSSWPATGTQLTDYAASFTDQWARIRFADDTRLFVSQPWVTPASSPAIQILTAEDGTIEGSRVISDGQLRGACSNGEYIFVAHDDGSSNIKITDIDISTPASGCGWTFGYTSTPTLGISFFSGICACGDTIVYTANTDVVVLNTTYGGTAHVTSTDPDIVEHLFTPCTDGVSFYAIGDRERTGTTTQIPALYRLDFVDYVGYNTGGSPLYEAMPNMQNHVKIFKVPSTVSATYDSVCFSDGESVWIEDLDVSGSLRRLRRSAR